jgi:hypothetical protein
VEEEDKDTEEEDQQEAHMHQEVPREAHLEEEEEDIKRVTMQNSLGRAATVDIVARLMLIHLEEIAPLMVDNAANAPDSIITLSSVKMVNKQQMTVKKHRYVTLRKKGAVMMKSFCQGRQEN